MSTETETLVIAGIVGVVLGLLGNAIAKDQACFVYIMSATLGAFVSGYTSSTFVVSVLTEVGFASVGAIGLTIVTKLVMRD